MSKPVPKTKQVVENANQKEDLPAVPLRTTLRWPLYLPSGDVKEIQILDISPDSPFYEYRSIPGAGKFYGGQVMTTRMKYIHVIIKKYLTEISNCIKAGQPISWPEGIMAADHSGLSILESEYFFVHPSLATSNGSSNSRDRKMKLNASQLIFGFEEPDHDWLSTDLDFSKGNFDGLKEDRVHYFIWLSSEISGEYREYRVDDRWIWNSYTTDYQTRLQEQERCEKFFNYVIEKSGEYSKEWKKVREGIFDELIRVFSHLSVNPKRAMTLFENLNFKNKMKWHCYKPLSHHGGLELNRVNQKFLTTFVDNTEINWKHSIDLVANKLAKMNEDEKNALTESAEASYRQVLERQMAMKTIESYKKLVDFCKNNNVDIQDVEKMKTLEVYDEFEKNVKLLFPPEQGVRHLRLENIDDSFALLDDIYCVSSYFRTNNKNISEKLRKLFQDARRMRHSLINGANAYEYRRRALLNTKNQDALAMQAKFVLACFDYKKQLSPFEESMLWAVRFPTDEATESVANLSRRLREASAPDKSLSKKEVLAQLHRNFRDLPAIFNEIRSETLAMGYNELEHVKVTFNAK